MRDVFLSYWSQDLDQARQVQRSLQGRGISTFLDRDDLPRGQPWLEEIEKALEGCRAVVVLLGRELGPWQRREIGIALGRQGERGGAAFPVIPVLLAGANPVRGFLVQNTWVDLRRDLNDGAELAALANAIQGAAPVAARPLPPGVSPFRGLEPFREDDAPFFFGREAMVARLVEKVGRNKLVALIGASGSGKSSVALAGLVPALRRLCRPEPTWDAFDFTPGHDPWRRLARAVVGMLEPDLRPVDQVSKATELGQRWEQGEPLGPYLEEIRRQTGVARVLLIVDQLEELLTQTPELRRPPFLQFLLAALDGEGVQLLLTLRGDFYSAVTGLDRQLSRQIEAGVFNLDAMDRTELRRAMEEPPRRLGISFEPNLVDRLLDDAGLEPGHLPLLEYALQELWNLRVGDRLVAPQDFDPTRAIGARAQRVLESLSIEHQAAARRLLVRLVHSSTGLQGLENTRQRLFMAALPPEAGVAIQAFAAKDIRLLVTSRDGDREAVEVAHEKLITAWPTYQDWLVEDQEFRLWRQRIAPSLEYFAEDPATLLHGQALSDAERWLTARSDDLLPNERTLIEASQSARDHEAEQERALTAERLSQAEENSRRARRERWMSNGILVLAAFVLAAVYLIRESATIIQRANARGGMELANAAIQKKEYEEALAYLASAIRSDTEWAAPRAAALNVLFEVAGPRFRIAGQSLSCGKIFEDTGEGVQIWDLVAKRRIGRELPRMWMIDMSDDCRFIKAIMPNRKIVFISAAGDDLQIGDYRLDSQEQILSFDVDRGVAVSTEKRGTVVRVRNFGNGRNSNWISLGGGWVGDNVYFAPDGPRLIVRDSGSFWVKSGLSGKPVGAAMAPFQERREYPVAGFVSERIIRIENELWDSAQGEKLCSFEVDIPRSEILVLNKEGKVIQSCSAGALLQPLKTSAYNEEVVEARIAALLGPSILQRSKLSEELRDCWLRSMPADISKALVEEATRRIRHIDPDVRRFTFYDYSIPTDLLPSTARQLTMDSGWFWQKPGRPRPRFRHGDSINLSASSSSGRWVATAAGDRVSVWDLSTGKKIRVLPNHATSALAISSQSWVAVANGKEVKLWNSSARAGGSLIHQEVISHLSFSKDGSLLAAASGQGTIRVWDTSTASMVGPAIAVGGWPQVLGFGEGSELITVDSKCTLEVWHPSSGQRRSHRDLTSKAEGKNWSSSACQVFDFAADSASYLRRAADTQGIEIGLINSEDSRLTLDQGRKRNFFRATLSSDAKWVLTTGEGQTARIWDGRSGMAVGAPIFLNESAIWSQISADGRNILTLSAGVEATGLNQLDVWDLLQSKPDEAVLVAEMAETIGGISLGASGLVATPDRGERLQELRGQIKSAPFGEPTVLSFARWLFTDSWERPISPGSRLTVEEYICDALRFGDFEDAEMAFPGHPLLEGGKNAPMPALCSEVLAGWPK